MTVENQNMIAIFWGKHSPGTDAFAERLNAKSFKIHFANWSSPLLAPLKYIPMWVKTRKLLASERPSSVLVINTPVFAPLCVYLYCRSQNIPFVMDIHGHSFIGWKWAWSRPLHKFLARRATANLVDFTEYEELFTRWGAKAIKLERPPFLAPILREGHPEENGQFSITVISTFNKDEPLDLVVEVARKMPEIKFYILGDTKLADPKLLATAPDNVVFPGYLKNEDYWQRLNDSDVLMTLTDTPKSLVSGGIEAMTLGKPMILSSQPVLIDYFTKGAIFISHTEKSMIEGINRSRSEMDVLTKESKELLIEKQSRWENSLNELRSLLSNGN
ncbi:glycosyltransferase [bacterium]|nr:glycosyltransferase [bacterium]